MHFGSETDLVVKNKKNYDTLNLVPVMKENNGNETFKPNPNRLKESDGAERPLFCVFCVGDVTPYSVKHVLRFQVNLSSKSSFNLNQHSCITFANFFVVELIPKIGALA